MENYPSDKSRWRSNSFIAIDIRLANFWTKGFTKARNQILGLHFDNYKIKTSYYETKPRQSRKNNKLY